MESTALPNAGPIRFTCEALNGALWQRAPARFGMRSTGTFNNLVSNCRKLLVLTGQCDGKLERTPAWQALYDRLPTRERQMGQASLMQFCSARDISPDALPADVLDFAVWCRTRQLKGDIPALVRRTASGWNWAAEHVEGWPQVRLTQPDMRDHYTQRLDAYPASFQDEVNTYFTQLATDPRERMFTGGGFQKSSGKSPRSRPHAARPRTIATKLSYVLAAGAALIQAGIPIESITSLNDLVTPQSRVDTIVKFHFARRKAHEAEQRFSSRPAHLIGIIARCSRRPFTPRCSTCRSTS